MEGLLGPQKNRLALLLDLREAKKLDPWSIEISEALKEAVEAFKSLERVNFALLGLLLLNSSVIYELKAESLLQEKRAEPDGQETGASSPGEIPPFVPGLLRPRVDFLATVVSSLLSSIGRERTSSKGRRRRLPGELKPPPPPEPDFDIEEWREHILAILRARGPVMPLEDVLAVFGGSEAIKAFLTLLHMAQEGLISFSRSGSGAVLVSLMAMGEP